MKHPILKRVAYLLIFLSLNISFSQEAVAENSDSDLKESLYKKYKNEVRSFDRKKFDNLFLDFFDKSAENKTTLSKEEFYTYTIKIAIYSEKLGLLYKDQKEEAQKAKQDWFDKDYSDYLNSKK